MVDHAFVITHTQMAHDINWQFMEHNFLQPVPWEQGEQLWATIFVGHYNCKSTKTKTINNLCDGPKINSGLMRDP